MEFFQKFSSHIKRRSTSSSKFDFMNLKKVYQEKSDSSPKFQLLRKKQNFKKVHQALPSPLNFHFKKSHVDGAQNKQPSLHFLPSYYFVRIGNCQLGLETETSCLHF